MSISLIEYSKKFLHRCFWVTLSFLSCNASYTFVNKVLTATLEMIWCELISYRADVELEMI